MRSEDPAAGAPSARGPASPGPSRRAAAEDGTPPRPAEREDGARFLNRLLRGDEIAFARITGVITAVISRMGAFELRDSWADIAQEVLEVIIANVRGGHLRDPAALVAYAQTITRRRVLHWVMRHGRAPASTDPIRLSELEGSPSREDPGLRVDLERALDELPDTCRRVIEETYVRGRTYEETASRLGLSHRQVKRLQSRGLALLRRSLEVR